jgi:ubiquinone/menaquinone biosynthesis C-methylase UbiE
MKNIKYSFQYITNCNMCGSPLDKHRILGKRLNQSQGKNPKSKIGITTTIMKCNSCELIYANPLPIPHNIQDHYGVPPESYWTEKYFTVNDNDYKGLIEMVNSHMKTGDNRKALDIGAGIGKCMIALSNAGYDTYGIEPSEPFYKNAIEKMKIDPAKLKLEMIEEAEYPDNYFDFITFGAVLEHLYDPSLAIKKSMKWLKPGGIIYIEVPSSNWLVNKLINLNYKLRGLDYVGNISPMHSPFHLYEFGLKSFSEHANQNNYEIALYYYQVCKTYMPKIVDYIIKPYMAKTDTGMQLSVFLRKK